MSRCAHPHAPGSAKLPPGVPFRYAGRLRVRLVPIAELTQRGAGRVPAARYFFNTSIRVLPSRAGEGET
jgi:hypothetical protein